MKVNLVRRPWGFLFADDDDAMKARSIKQNTVVEATFRTKRSLKLHHKFFALISTAWEFLTEQQQEFFHNSKDGFRHTLTIAAGYYETVYSITRKQWLETPRSIAFDKMNEAEFSKLYEDVVNLIFKLFLSKNNVNKDAFYSALKDF